MSPDAVEIKYVAGDGIYDLFVDGRFKNFYRTFSEAVLSAEKILYPESNDIVRQWKDLPPKKGKVHGAK